MKSTLLILSILLFALSTKAATFTVTNLNDSGNGTLRQAIASANANPDPDTINFANNLNGTITLTSGELSISQNLTINGLGADTIKISGNSQSRIFNLDQTATASINNLTVSGALLADSLCGGGILNNGNLTANNLKIINNYVGNMGCGGGLANYSQLTIANSTVDSNGGPAALGYTSFGGGIYNTGTLIIINSTISNNSAREGGGIRNLGDVSVKNSTICSNTGGSTFGVGGGIYGGTVTMENSTVARNYANQNGGGIMSTLTVYNSIIADNNVNSQPPTPNGTRTPNVNGPVTSLGNNLINDTTGSSGWISSDIINVNAQLGTFGDNGGFTQTVAIGFNSPAYNAGNNQNAPVTDQRGLTRIVGGTIDIGAYELQTVPCTYEVSPTILTLPANGGTTTVNVTTQAGCGWTAASNSTDATVSPSSGTGNGTVTITVSANTGPARTLTVTIANQTVTINQANGCAFTISPASQTFNAQGGSGSITVTANNASCPWSSLSNVPWIATFSNGNSTGNGTVQYSVAANNGPARTGTITVAGQTFTVIQSGQCTFTLSQTSLTFSASEGSITVTVNKSDPQCFFSAVSNAPWIFIADITQGANVGSVSFSIQQNTGPQRVGTVIVGEQTLTITQQSGARTAFDFDGDGRADISVFRPTFGAWYLLNSQTGFTGTTFGQNGDQIVPADYDGDGKTDLAVFRSGVWYIQRSQLGFTGIQFGIASDIPVPGDYDGDGKADLAVFRANGLGYFYILNSSNNSFRGTQFGQTGDKPVVADFDGDGKADVAVYRPSAGAWYIQRSQLGFTAILFGISEDKPIAADFDGDGKTDIAVFRPSGGTWYLLQSTAGFYGTKFGEAGDLPTVADYDGDGKADIAVFRSGVWYLNRSTSGFTGVQFGQNGDVPVQNAFVR